MRIISKNKWIGFLILFSMKLTLDSFIATSVAQPKKNIEKPEEAVSRIKEMCLSILYQAAKNKNSFIRSAAYRSAGESGDPSLIPFLKQGAKDVYPTARQFALQTLRKISPKDALALAEEMASDSDIWVKSLVIETLADEGGPVFIPKIKEYLNDPDETIHLAVAEALFKLGQKHRLPFLIGYLDHSIFRDQVIGRLGNLNNILARHHLEKLLSDSDPQTVYYTLKALGKNPNSKIISNLRELIHHPHPSVRKEAATVLGKLHIVGSEALLQGVCFDEDAMVRLAAAVALNKLNSKACQDEFARALDNPDYGVRSASARILGMLNLPEREILLAKAMKDKNSRVRSAAVRATGMMGGPKALSLLLNVLHDPQEVIRTYAAGNLIKILN